MEEILNQKLKNPKMQLNPEESIELIQYCTHNNISKKK